jgi:glycogen(starch) synthase
MATSEQARAELLFEISWEVCNKVGGIYTVLHSKLPFINRRYPEYVLIGPLFDKDSPEFERRTPPARWQEAFDTLATQGIQCAYGAWLAPSEPTVILVGARGLVERRNDLKRRMWEDFGIDSLRSQWEFDEPLCFSTAAGMLVEEYVRRRPGVRAIVQCHEWMAGFALLHLKRANAPVASVFTTHATILGRTIMGSGHPLYDLLPGLDPNEWAYRLGVQDKHLAETACARNADVFTTVSEITGAEAQRILGRAPDVLLYNGFYTEQFPTIEETGIRHAQSKETLRELATYAFFPHHAFNLDQTLFFFTSGRYEFTNKGIDVLIEALGRVNERMKDEGSERTIVMFFWLIMGRRNVRLDMLENKSYYHHVKQHVERQSRPLLQRIVQDIISRHAPGKDDALSGSFLARMHAQIAPLRREGDPPLVTHDIPNAQDDPVLHACAANGLRNREEDKIKVLLFPGYLDGSDGLLNVQYYDATAGAHLGVFPSHYEPWGYTPLECAVLGIPAITTDLAGFGQFMQGADPHGRGVFVIPRKNRARDQVVQDLAEHLFAYAHMEHEERVRHGIAAKAHSELCDWRHFIKRYIVAHNTALERKGL